MSIDFSDEKSYTASMGPRAEARWRTDRAFRTDPETEPEQEITNTGDA